MVGEGLDASQSVEFRVFLRNLADVWRVDGVWAREELVVVWWERVVQVLHDLLY